MHNSENTHTTFATFETLTIPHMSQDNYRVVVHARNQHGFAQAESGHADCSDCSQRPQSWRPGPKIVEIAENCGRQVDAERVREELVSI
jgi:hypothetical protein